MQGYAVRRGPRLALAVLFVLLPSCGPSSPPAADTTPAAADIAIDQVLQQVDEVLAFTLHERHVSVEQHAAWQILHGILAFGPEFQIERDGTAIPALDYLLAGGRVKGWELEVVTDEQTGRRGIRTLMDPGSQAGQGHADQWLGYVSEAGVPLDREIRVGNETLTMQDWILQSQWDAPRNVQREYSWTLVGLSRYLPPGATWTASDGTTWSMARLVEIEAAQELGTSACGGAHRLVGLTRALTRHRAEGGALAGSWAAAAEVIQQAVAHARQYQNPDGSFSTRFFESAGSSPDLAQNLGSTGHILEFLALALPPEELREPWVSRAVLSLCELFRLTRDMPLECGALYHATHGLVQYRRRLSDSNQDPSALTAADGPLLP